MAPLAGPVDLRRRVRGPEPYERVVMDELACHRVVSQVTPAEDDADQPKSVGMMAAEVEGHIERPPRR